MRGAAFRRIPLALGLVSIATLVALFAIVGPGAAGPASAATNRCPNSNAIKNFKQATNVAASFSNAGNVTTYTFFSLTNENPVGGVPGLIDYCVYPTAGTAAPTNVTPLAKGADGALWQDPPVFDNFSFVRPDGDKSNIPLDGKTTTMGTATWTTVPNAQTILLHINDSAVCESLYGKEDHNKDGHGLFPSNGPWPSLFPSNGPWPSDGHGQDGHGKEDHGEEGTCFVTPSPAPNVCEKGDTTLAYNALSFGAVNCFKASYGLEAQSANEFGDGVQLAGTATGLAKLDVLFASFGCGTSGHWNTGNCVTTPGATFTVPITANIYDKANLTGTPLATVTQSVAIPYRPSADPQCTGADAGKWFNPAAPGGGGCQSSLGTIVSFPLSGTVPASRQVVWTVAYNTTHYGYHPVGEQTACFATGNNPGCGYDSLNVGATSFVNAPYAGTDLDENTAYASTLQPPSALQPETGFTGFRPLGAIRTQ